MRIMLNNLKIAVALVGCMVVLLLTLSVSGIAAAHTDSNVIYMAPAGVMIQSMLLAWLLLKRVEPRVKILGIYPMDGTKYGVNRAQDIWPKQK